MPHVLILCLVSGMLAAVLTDIVLLAGIFLELRKRTHFVRVTEHFLEQISSRDALHENLDTIQEEILSHLDDFIRNRLATELPVLKLFIDDKLIAELKTVFAREMDRVLPKVLDSHLAGKIFNSLDAVHLLTRKLHEIIRVKVRNYILKMTAPMVLLSLACGALGGLLVYYL